MSILRAGIYQNELGAYCVPDTAKPTESLYKSISRGDIHEQHTIDFVQRNGSLDADIIHAGAYYGDMLPAFSTAYRRVFAFEPVRESFRCAQITILLNDLENVVLSHAALGQNSSPEAYIRTYREDESHLAGGCNIVSFQKMGEKTTMIAIDDLENIQPSLIHLDVESYEIEALKGAMNTLQQRKPILILESIDNGWKAEKITHEPWVREVLFPMGYQVADFAWSPQGTPCHGRLNENIVLHHPDRVPTFNPETHHSYSVS